MTVPVYCVLRSGGDFSIEHVWRLKRQLTTHTPGYRSAVSPDEGGTWSFNALTDVQNDRVGAQPLVHSWPGWWAKLELFRPDIEPGRTLLFMDLDTTIVGDVSPLWADTSRSNVTRDFFRGRYPGRKHVVQTTLMLLTAEDRAAVWAEWQDRGPESVMPRYRSDQEFIEPILAMRDVDRFQDTHLGMVVGYKSEIRRPGLSEPPDGARVVCFHGNPRPWETDHDWANPSPFVEQR